MVKSESNQIMLADIMLKKSTMKEFFFSVQINE